MPTFVCPYCDAMTFSITLMLRNRRSVWNVRATPRCVIVCGARPTRLSPSSRISPLVGPVDAGDEVEQRRLAGAVRPDDADDLVLVDLRGRGCR